MRRAILKAAIAVSLIGSTTAQAADFIFTFGSDLSDPNVDPARAQSGAVSGRILGLADDGMSGAQSVFIDAYSLDGSLVPIDVMLWFSPFDIDNLFTVENGEIVSALFRRSNEFGSSFDRLFLNVPIFEAGGTNYASLGSNNTLSIWNNQGLQGVTFTRIDTGVPETATWALMLFGFGAIGLATRRSRERALGSAYDFSEHPLVDPRQARGCPRPQRFRRACAWSRWAGRNRPPGKARSGSGRRRCRRWSRARASIPVSSSIAATITS